MHVLKCWITQEGKFIQEEKVHHLTCNAKALWTTFFRRFGLQRDVVWPNVPATQQKGNAKS